MFNKRIRLINGKFKQFYIYMICIIAAAFILGTGMQKKDLHVDEIYSYGLSNTSEGFTITPPVLQWTDKIERIFMDYLAVQEAERFNYTNVWRFQSLDVHPPFYYMLLHTICSFFPDSFSIFYALGINLSFYLLVIIFAYKTVLLLTESIAAASVTGLLLALSPVMLEANTFLRMYIMSMFWVVLFVWFVFKFQTKLQTKSLAENILYYLGLTAITICGVLTHYYFLIFLFFFSLFNCLRLLCLKQYRKVLAYGVSMAAAGALSILIFPAMPGHIFAGSRGKQSFDNLARAGYGTRVSEASGMLIERVLGGFLIVFIIAAAFSVFFYLHKKFLHIKEEGRNKKQGMTKRAGTQFKKYFRLNVLLESESMLLFLTVILYIFVVSITAPYMAIRYYYPILPLILILCSLWIMKAANNNKDKRQAAVLVCISIILLLIGQYKKCPWEYSYKDAPVPVAVSKENEETECVYIYADLNMWKTQNAFYELRNYKTIMFVPAGKTEELKKQDWSDKKRLIVYMQNDLEQAAMLQSLKEAGRYGREVLLYESHYDRVYLLAKS